LKSDRIIETKTENLIQNVVGKAAGLSAAKLAIGFFYGCTMCSVGRPAIDEQAGRVQV
jgi:hypothetical protein